MTQNESTPPLEILIAEDSRTQAELLRHVLEEGGYRVTTAPDGAAALASARSSPPNLVISDVEMPRMTGYEMCRAMKDDTRLSHVPVILLTSLSDPTDVLRGLEAGADYYLTKPFDPGELLVRVGLAFAGATNARDDSPDGPLTVMLEEGPCMVTAPRRQVVNLLLSTYANAVQRNRELIRSKTELARLNGDLTEKNRLVLNAMRSEHEAHETLKKAQSQMIQTEKMASLGQMVAGVAHEINNPLAFVSNNVAILQRDLAAVGKVLDLYKEAEESLGHNPELLGRIRELSEQFDLEYTRNNLQDLLRRSREGLQRIQEIVRNLRNFARLDESDLSEIDVNAAVESTMSIIRPKAKDRRVEIVLEAKPVPILTCFPAKLNQVFLNLVANAIDATEPGGKVTIRTNTNHDEIWVDVIDTGSGIDPAIREKIFDPFFTTKPIGQGTGLGLSISYRIIQEHKGTIEVESTPGKGSTFTVHLPFRERST